MNHRRDKTQTTIRRLRGEPSKKKRKRDGKDDKKREKRSSGSKGNTRKTKKKYLEADDNAEEQYEDWMEECLEGMFL